jgi:hypothetical protein
MQKLLAWSIAIYFTVYAFEGPVRYGLNLLGADQLIFVRDAVLLLPVLLLGAQQFLQRRVHPAYLVYIFVVLLHGLVLMLNIGSFAAVGYGAKMLLTMLVGAVIAPVLLQPRKPLLMYVGVLWVSIFIGVLLDKYFVSFPWVGLTTIIGDVQVDISKDWDMEGDAKRAGGFLRSSIHAATVAPLFALMLVVHLKRWWLRILIALATVFVINLTTQKGALLAYVIVIAVLACVPKRPIPALRLGLIVFTILAVALPLALPGYHMDEAGAGGFSNMSFNLRVEMMWPKAWEWISHRGTFPFGVGLGGISGAQLLYAKEWFNAADNLYVFMYASFGMMSVVYLGLMLWGALRVPNQGTVADKHALSILLFIMVYGCVLSMLEDQMASLFLGAALCWVGYDSKRQRQSDAGLITRVPNSGVTIAPRG